MSSVAGGPDIFLSYSTADRPHVLKVQEFLRQRGVVTFFDVESLDLGTSWLDGLQRAIDRAGAVAVFVGRHGLGNWQQHEVAIAMDRQAREKQAGRKLPVVPILLPGVDPEDAPSFVRVNVWIRLTGAEAEDARALERLLAAARCQPAEPTPEEAPPLCPYRGLKAFREEDADLFFGRDTFADQLLAHALAQRRLIAAVGPSGSGKSSVVQAGLLPRLRRQRPPAPTWSAVVLTPGKAPFHNLAKALFATWETQGTQVDRALEAEKLGQGLADGGRFELAIDPALGSLRTDKLLIVVDQFEELFTLTPQGDRDRFIGSLLAAMDPERVILALTLRADFYGRALVASRDLSDLLQQGLVNLGPMQPQELREVIEKPAAAAGLSFEPGLVDRILGEVENEPGALPLLEFALTELWQLRAGSQLTHRAYEAMGKVTGAVAQRAQTAFLKVPREQQPAALRGLTRLVRVAAADEEGSDTRQRTPLDSLDEPAQLAVAELTTARLLVLDAPAAAPDASAGSPEVVEIAHEALIRKWPLLKDRLDEDRKFLLWRQWLRQRMGEWQQTGRDRGALLAGALLTQARTWEKSRRDDLNEEEKEFFRASELAERRPFPWRAAAVAVLLVLVLVAAGAWGLTRTDRYQVWEIVKDVSENPAQIYASGAETAGNLAAALAFLGRTEEAVAVASKAKSDDQSMVFASTALALREASRYGEALTAAANLPLRVQTTEFATIAKDSVAALNLEEVERAAAKINDKIARSRAYSAIAHALLKARRAKEATVSAERAKTVALNIEEKISFGRSLALAEAADALAQLGLWREANDAAREAMAVAESVSDSRDKADALFAAAEMMIKVGDINAAMQVATREYCTESRGRCSELYSQAATALMKRGLTEQAFAMAARAYNRFGNPFDPPNPITSIAKTLVKSGRLQEAEAAALKLKDEDQWSNAFKAISQALMYEGRLREALVITDKIEGWSRRFGAAGWILQELISQEKISEAELMGRMKGFTSEAPSPSARVDALVETARMLARAGRLPEAREAAIQAQAQLNEVAGIDRYRYNYSVALSLIEAGELERAAKLARSERRLGFLFASIAEEWSKRGMRDKALAAVVEALATDESVLAVEAIVRVSDEPNRSLDEILDRADPRRSAAFVELAHALVRAGNLPEALKAAAAARTAVNTNHDPELAVVADVLIELGKPEEALILAGEMTSPGYALYFTAASALALAERTPDEALTAIEKLPNPSTRVEVLVRVVRALADARKADEAEAAAELAAKAAGEVGSDSEKSKAFKSLAGTWAYLGQLRLARRAADKCGVPDKVDAYATILLRYAEQRGSKESARWLKESDDAAIPDPLND